MIGPTLIQTDSSSAEPLVRLSHEAMACTFEVWIQGQDRPQARQSARAAFDEADRIEQEISRFVEQSDVSLLNRGHSGETVRVGIEAFECLKLALRVQHETHGAFDVTCSVDSVAGAAATGCPPPAIRLDEEDHTVTILRDDVRIDLGGIGKGYALDRMAEILSEWGVARGLVHAGQSTVLAIAAPGNDPAWSVSLRHPTAPETGLANPDDTEGRVCHCSVSSVGWIAIDRRALSGSGQLIHGTHIIDPRTGQPVSGPLAAWALAPSAAEADALSTALMVMTLPEVETYFADHPEVAGLLALPPAEKPRLLDFGMKIRPAP